MQQLTPRALVPLAVAEGASTPVAGPGASIWSTTAGKPLYWDLVQSKWTAFSGAAGAVSATQVTLNFGASPVKVKTFSFSAPAATTSSKVLMVPSAKPVGTRSVDELEMDNFTCAATCLANGTITAVVTACPGPVTGSYNFNYILG